MVGITVGFSVVLLFKLFAFVHNLFFLGKISFTYNELLHTPISPFGIAIILVPVIGSFIVTFILEKFAPRERGLSVPDIIYKIHFKAGEIKPLSAIAKAIAAMISIATGASLGREGPLIQLSAAISSIISNIVNLSTKEKAVLIAAGAAAGTSVAFNAPIGGLLFVIEVLLLNINVSGIVLIILAEISAMLVKFYLFSNISLFLFPNVKKIFTIALFSQQLLLYPLLGIALGLLSVLFIRGLYFTEDLFHTVFKNPYIRHAIGMLIVGFMFYLFMYFWGHYYIEGIGFATISDVLKFLIKNPWLLLLLLICKLLATFLTLSSGASGGIFSPALFIGAMMGGIAGIINMHIFGGADSTVISFVIAGMAAMLACVTGGVITAIALCIEMTNGYEYILPILITVITAFITRRALCSDSVYTLKLTRQKHRMPVS